MGYSPFSSPPVMQMQQGQPALGNGSSLAAALASHGGGFSLPAPNIASQIPLASLAQMINQQQAQTATPSADAIMNAPGGTPQQIGSTMTPGPTTDAFQNAPTSNGPNGQAVAGTPAQMPMGPQGASMFGGNIGPWLSQNFGNLGGAASSPFGGQMSGGGG